jgi:hypothetical protein
MRWPGMDRTQGKPVSHLHRRRERADSVLAALRALPTDLAEMSCCWCTMRRARLHHDDLIA